MILRLAITVFVTQLIFIGARTWNIQSIAKGNILKAIISGAIVHLAWLVSIAIGAVSMNEIITNFRWEYFPIVIGSLSGGLIGTYLSMKNKHLK